MHKHSAGYGHIYWIGGGTTTHNWRLTNNERFNYSNLNLNTNGWNNALHCERYAATNTDANIILKGKVKGSPYSITEHRVPDLIPVLGSQSAGDMSHKLGVRLPLLSARSAVTPATPKRAATNFAAW